MGHGITESIYDSVWAIAPQLAAAGIATAAIHYAGHGGGERGTLEVLSRDCRVVMVPSGGRGIDEDGDGLIGRLEGLYGAPPRAVVSARDGTRQTVIDLMQLVREIQVGVDLEGDGRVDLDATRITFVGHSAGANYGTVLLAIEPSIAAGALNCPGGQGVDIYRLGGFRQILGRALAARTPSLLNATVADDPAKPLLAFIDEIPLRDQPVKAHSTAGSMEIQQVLDRMSWVSQSSNAVAYAPYLRASPLAGHPKKRVLVQFAKGDRLMANPLTSAMVRAGRLADLTTLYRADLARTSEPGAMPEDPHSFLLDGVDTAERSFALAAQRQIATFLGSAGRRIPHPDGDGAIFETPIRGQLPEDLGFLP
jgi:acetyl esterase/lipase